MSSLSSNALVHGDFMSIPVIDFKHLDQNYSERRLVIQNIRSICKKMACFQVINHGIQPSICNEALEAATNFFNLPSETKAVYESNDVMKPVRYESSSNDGLMVSRSFLKHYAYPLHQWTPLWPITPSDYRQKMECYASQVRKIALQLIDAILESIGLGQGYFKHKFSEGMQFIAVNHYPKYSSNLDSNIGLGSHTDYGFLTILLQSSQGLQVFDGDNWRRISFQPETLYVQVGDFLEVLSNGEYKGVLHRAILNNEMERISIASIHGFSMNEKVSPAEELVHIDRNPRRYREGNFDDFLHYLGTNGTKEERFIDSLRII